MRSTGRADAPTACMTAMRCLTDWDVASPVVPSRFSPSQPPASRRPALATSRSRSGSPVSRKGVAMAAITPRRVLLIRLPELYRLADLNRLVIPLEEFHRDEDELRVTHVLDRMDEVLTQAMMEVAGFARVVVDVDDAAVLVVTARNSSRRRGPEVVEHMAVKREPAARREREVPDPHAFGLGDQDAA